MDTIEFDRNQICSPGDRIEVFKHHSQVSRKGRIGHTKYIGKRLNNARLGYSNDFP